MKLKLLEYLADPTDCSQLIYDNAKQLLINIKTNEEFKIEQNVPILLKKGASSEVYSTLHHERADTEFTYVDHYQKDAEEFDYFEPYSDGATIHENRRLHETILRQIPNSVNTILDVGSGGAWLAKSFQNTTKEVISFDISKANAIRALHDFPFKNHHAVIGDVYAMPFRPGSIDCIVSAEVIEHVSDPALFITKLLEILKPGGILILTTPYNETIQYSLCIHCNCVTPLHAHLHSFNKEKIKSLLSTSAVKSIELSTFSNKALTMLRTHVLFKYMPFSLWKFIDNISNKIVKKPVRLMMKVIK